MIEPGLNPIHSKAKADFLFITQNCKGERKCVKLVRLKRDFITLSYRGKKNCWKGSSSKTRRGRIFSANITGFMIQNNSFKIP